MRTITALVRKHAASPARRKRDRSTVRRVAIQTVASFDLIDQLFHRAGEAAVRLRDNLPKNWPHDGKLLNNVCGEDGISVVYAPRAEIVRAILEEDDYDSRSARRTPDMIRAG